MNKRWFGLVEFCSNSNALHETETPKDNKQHGECGGVKITVESLPKIGESRMKIQIMIVRVGQTVHDAQHVCLPERMPWLHVGIGLF